MDLELNLLNIIHGFGLGFEILNEFKILCRLGLGFGFMFVDEFKSKAKNPNQHSSNAYQFWVKPYKYGK